MPEDYDLYYGFTRFAMELNELDPELEKILPPTDTRFRPDQRFISTSNKCSSLSQYFLIVFLLIKVEQIIYLNLYIELLI